MSVEYDYLQLAQQPRAMLLGRMPMAAYRIVDQMFPVFMACVPEDERQEYDCRCCRKFIDTYATMFTPTVSGPKSLVWSGDTVGAFDLFLTHVLRCVSNAGFLPIESLRPVYPLFLSGRRTYRAPHWESNVRQHVGLSWIQPLTMPVWLTRKGIEAEDEFMMMVMAVVAGKELPRRYIVRDAPRPRRMAEWLSRVLLRYALRDPLAVMNDLSLMPIEHARFLRSHAGADMMKTLRRNHGIESTSEVS